MVERANKKTNPLHVEAGDYVYMKNEMKGKGQKLKQAWLGVYIVEKVTSPHMVQLRDAKTNKCLKEPVHLDRLKMAYVREPNPMKYFGDKVMTNKAEQQLNIEENRTTSNMEEENEEPVVANRGRKSSRNKKPTERYGIHMDLSHESVSSDSAGYHKIKRILEKRGNRYLVQLAGEPAHAAIWCKLGDMNRQGKKKVMEFDRKMK